MHIAVSLTGEGSGHATRMTALCRALRDRHEISIWCPLHTRRIMQHRLPGCQFHPLPWLQAVYRGNRVRLLATAWANFGLFLRTCPTAMALARDLQLLSVDAVVSDYDPFLSLAGLAAGRPVVQLNHQGVVDRHPALRLSWFVAWLTNRLMMPPATARMVSSFYSGDVGPLLRPEITGRREKLARFVVVYARNGFAEHILPVLGQLPETEFRVFPSERYDFAESLAACRGVIAPAGHQLMSEALHLGKPVLAFPQDNQYEQELNARMLERSGWGLRGRIQHVAEDVGRFLQLIPSIPLHRPKPSLMFRLHDSTDQAATRIEHVLVTALARRRRRPVRPGRRASSPRVAT
ncbi:MAG TPA: glycosyltransferase family protein [bacterium]|nr:glycosyltransferase family protein [bacterium]